MQTPTTRSALRTVARNTLVGLGLAGVGVAGIGAFAPSTSAAPALIPAATATTDRDPATVVTTGGAVRGTVKDKVRSFQGIPYATADRFAAPLPAKPWKGVRDATAPGKVCAQPAGYPIGRPSTDEDCLNLNVTTPTTLTVPATPTSPTARGGRLPVIVWIHGGSMMFGMGDLYGPDRLAAGGAVVVSMNYRLGVTSFLTHPDLPESGGLALDDQRAALRWVHDNIASFGGDPGRVTIMGQSGGGFGVCGQLASPASEGLFHRAIVQSAPCSTPKNASRTRAEADAESKKLIKDVGCAPKDAGPRGTAACLRAARIGTLLATYGAAHEPRPVSGTPQLPLPVDQALRTGRFNRVPVLVGVNHDEENGMVLGQELATGKPMTAEEYAPAVRAQFRKQAPQVLKRYPLNGSESAGQTLARVRTDATWSAPTLTTARDLARHAPVRMYEFAERDTPWFRDTPKPSFPAAAQHMAELPSLFDIGLFADLSAEQSALADRMIGAWTRFAATGDPNGGGENVWPRLRTDRGASALHIQSLTKGPWKPADFVRDHKAAFWTGASEH
ncbi:carboxylesterase/lipase family protein [Streptomyces sp. NPDC051561]|uniref:carboxylesterase/lipase family protein n=1 Tax=Streptomyces sp. NPDC051561 TaxID=3365658 RepID=UPI00379A4469